MVINKIKKSAVVLLTAAAAFSFSVMPLPANAADIMTTGQVPSGITAAAVDYNTVKVTWNAAVGASAYNVYRAKGNGSYTLKSTTSGTSYTADNLATGSTYHFIVTTGKLISSSSSAQTQSLASVSSVTEVSAKPKLAQTSVSASTKSYQTIKVSWTAVAGANKYKVYRKKGSGSYKKIKTTSAKSYTSSGLRSSTAYTYKVKAVRSTSTYSYAKSGANTASAKTKSFDADGRIQHRQQQTRLQICLGCSGPGQFRLQRLRLLGLQKCFRDHKNIRQKNSPGILLEHEAVQCRQQPQQCFERRYPPHRFEQIQHRARRHILRQPYHDTRQQLGRQSDRLADKLLPHSRDIAFTAQIKKSGMARRSCRFNSHRNFYSKKSAHFFSSSIILMCCGQAFSH